MATIVLNLQHLDGGATAVEWKREQSPGAVRVFGFTVFVDQVEPCRNSSTWDGPREFSHNSHPPINGAH